MTAAQPQPKPQRLTWPVRLAWLVCAMRELLKSFAWDAFVLFFYAQVVGLSGHFFGQPHRVLGRLAGALRQILQHWMRGIAKQRDAAL